MRRACAQLRHRHLGRSGPQGPDQLGHEERFVLTRNGRAVAALVPIGVLRDLEDAEDAADLDAARRAVTEGGPNVPHAQVLADLVADEGQPRGA
ncbi:MAG: hypothetical protein ACRDVW_04995 [Acidimicrobiales bacterium]